MCTWLGDVYMTLCLFLGDTCKLMIVVMKWEWWEQSWVILINDDYFGDGDNVWIICTWLGDSFDGDEFLTYTFEMMNCFVWVN